MHRRSTRVAVLLASALTLAACQLLAAVGPREMSCREWMTLEYSQRLEVAGALIARHGMQERVQSRQHLRASARPEEIVGAAVGSITKVCDVDPAPRRVEEVFLDLYDELP